jgi:ABC-type Co2+ transport system permease subunit
MTIRDYLKRRWGKITLAGISVLFVTGVMARSHLDNHGLASAIWAVGVATVAMFGWTLYRTPCPGCSKPMGGTAVWITRGRVGDHKRCPQCRISLDDQIPAVR